MFGYRSKLQRILTSVLGVPTKSDFWAHPPPPTHTLYSPLGTAGEVVSKTERRMETKKSTIPFVSSLRFQSSEQYSLKTSKIQSSIEKVKDESSFYQPVSPCSHSTSTWVLKQNSAWYEKVPITWFATFLDNGKPFGYPRKSIYFSHLYMNSS